MSKVIIVGHHGFIAQRLLATGKFREPIYTTSRNSNDQDSLYLDLETPQSFDYASIESCDTIVLLAAISAPDECKNNFDHAYAVNVTGESYFIEHCMKRGARVVFASSDVVYGESNKAVNESDDINPLGPYAGMKSEIEQKFIGSKLFKAIRFSYVFAKNDKFTSYVLDCIKKDEVCEVFEPFSRPVVYIEDVVDGIVSLCNNWNILESSTINFSGPKLLSRAEFVGAFQHYFNKPDIKVTYPGEQFYESRPRIINMESKYFKHLLGRQPHSIAEAIVKEFNIQENSHD